MIEKAIAVLRDPNASKDAKDLAEEIIRAETRPTVSPPLIPLKREGEDVPWEKFPRPRRPIPYWEQGPHAGDIRYSMSHTTAGYN